MSPPARDSERSFLYPSEFFRKERMSGILIILSWKFQRDHLPFFFIKLENFKFHNPIKKELGAILSNFHWGMGKNIFGFLSPFPNENGKDDPGISVILLFQISANIWDSVLDFLSGLYNRDTSKIRLLLIWASWKRQWPR